MIFYFIYIYIPKANKMNKIIIDQTTTIDLET